MAVTTATLPYGVMATQQILVLLFEVRVLVGQLTNAIFKDIHYKIHSLYIQ